jgi:hypothetical protein
MTRHSTRAILPLLAAASLLLTACSGDTPDTTQAEASTTPSTSATNPTTAAPRWTSLADKPENDVPLVAGLYGLTANGVSDHLAVVQAPEGYHSSGGWTLVTGEPFHAMGFVTPDRVPPDPCGSKGHKKFDAAVDPGPSVEDLADALVAQKGAVTSEPVPVTVGGHPGLYLTYRVGKGIDVRKCEERAFDLFTTGPPGGVQFLDVARERAAIWILDVDGERLVLLWVAVPGVPRAQMREMTRMVQSAHFVEQ